MQILKRKIEAKIETHNTNAFHVGMIDRIRLSLRFAGEAETKSGITTQKDTVINLTQSETQKVKRCLE